MARLEEANPLDYRQGGDTIDDFAQKYMKEIGRIYQFLNNLREHNSTGANQVEPAPYQLRCEDGKLYIRNEENTEWLYLFDVVYRMGVSDNATAKIITTDNVTSTTEALKLVQTDSDGKIATDTLGNATTATALQEARQITIADYAEKNSSTPISFDGSKDITILLPKKIDGEFSGSFEGDFHGKFTGDAPDYILKTNIAAGSLGEIVTTLGKLVAVDADGLLPVNIRGNAGKLAGVNVAVTNPEDGQVLAYRVASNTWTNEARAVVGEGKTLAIYDGDTLLGEYSGGKTVTIDLGTAKIKADVEQDLTKAVEEMKKTIADFFDIDENGSLMPAENPHFSNQFELDNDGAIMPKEAN